MEKQEIETLDEKSQSESNDYDILEKGDELQCGYKEQLLFFLLGNASLLAFNVIINAVDIYTALTGKTGTAIGNDLNRSYNIPCSITAFLLCFVKPRNLKVTLLAGLSVVTILLCILPIFMLVEMDQNTIYWATVVCIALVGCCSSINFSTSFSFAFHYSDSSVPYVSSGNGCCGVIAATMRLITKGIKDTPLLNSIYFFLSAAIYIFTIIYLIMKTRQPHIQKKLYIEKVETTEGEVKANYKAVFKAIWPLWLSVFTNFLVTLTLYPGYMVGTWTPASMGTWGSIIITTIFCVFDWVGRAIPSYIPPFPSYKWSWVPVALRLLFFPIFILSIQRIVNLGDPWWTFVWDIVFAVSNGYAGTINIIHGNNHPEIKTSEDKQLAGFCMPFAVNAGIFVAMFLSMAMPVPPIQ